MVIPPINLRFLSIMALIAGIVLLFVALSYLGIALDIIPEKGFLTENAAAALFATIGTLCSAIIGYWWNAKPPEKKKKVLIPEPKEWIETNHSHSKIVLVPEEDKAKREEVDRLVGETFKTRLFRLTRVDEDSGSRNYLIRPFWGRSFLFRIQQRINSQSALRALIKIHRIICKSDVFKSSPYREHLLPKPINGKDYGVIGEFLVIGFPFVHVKRHYEGDNDEELVSVAEKLGGIQRVLSKIPIEIVSDLKIVQESIVGTFPTKKELEEVLHRVEHKQKYDDSEEKDVVCESFRELWEYLLGAWDQMDKTLNEQAPKFPCLHDFHPHNTFIKNNECVLIYDYEAVSCYWSEEAALAFSLHRFCRENIRIQRIRDPRLLNNSQRLKDCIKESIMKFLKGYEKGRGSLPGDILNNLSALIVYTNTPKLLSAMNYYLKAKGIKDPARRKTETHQAEAIKFMSYIKEARLFDVF